MDKEENQCSELSERTINILDNDVLVHLFVSTQKNNLDLCIKNGILWVFIVLIPNDLLDLLSTSPGIYGKGVSIYYIWNKNADQIKYRNN